MKNILIILALCTLLMGCGDDYCTYNKNIKDKNLTAETQHGAQTMSCKIDGKVWVANGDNNARNCVGGVGFFTDGLLVNGFTTFKCARLRAYIEFQIDTNYYTLHNGAKRYMLGRTPTKYGLNNATVKLRDENLSFYSDWEPNEDGGGGWVEITRLDRTAQIISGRFEFVCYDGIHPPVRITEGRFDWSWKDRMPCNSLM